MEDPGPQANEEAEKRASPGSEPMEQSASPGQEDKVAGSPGLGEALGLPESFLKGVCTGQGLA